MPSCGFRVVDDDSDRAGRLCLADCGLRPYGGRKYKNSKQQPCLWPEYDPLHARTPFSVKRLRFLALAPGLSASAIYSRIQRGCLGIVWHSGCQAHLKLGTEDPYAPGSRTPPAPRASITTPEKSSHIPEPLTCLSRPDESHRSTRRLSEGHGREADEQSHPGS